MLAHSVRDKEKLLPQLIDRMQKSVLCFVSLSHSLSLSLSLDSGETSTGCVPGLSQSGLSIYFVSKVVSEIVS